MNIKVLIGSLVFFLVAMALGWYAGLGFMQRNFLNAAHVLIALGCGIIGGIVFWDIK